MSSVEAKVTALVPSLGVVLSVGIGLFQDAEASLPLTEVGWGVLYPGSTMGRTVYVRNMGDAPLTLSFNVLDWNPSQAPLFISVSWSEEGKRLEKGEVRPTELILTVSPDIKDIREFSMNLVFEGTP